jgi:hypothetical protein
VEVELRGENVAFDAAEIESLKRVIGKRGLAVERVETDVRVGEVVAVAIRLRAALAAAENRARGRPN